MSRAAERLIEAHQERFYLIGSAYERNKREFTQAGRRAFVAGGTECPYKPGCAAWTWWIAGFHEAEKAT